MPSLGDLKQRIATDLSRPNLAARISEAISSAIRFYGHELFPHNWQTLNLLTVPGQHGYVLPVDGGRVLSVDYVVMDNTLRTTLRQRDQAWIAGRYHPTVQGDPSYFALRGQELFLHPIPNREWEVFARLNISPAEPASDDQANFWTEAGFDLIRHKAKHDLFTNVIRGPAAGEGNMALQQAMLERDNLQRSATFNAPLRQRERGGWV